MIREALLEKKKPKVANVVVKVTHPNMSVTANLMKDIFLIPESAIVAMRVP